MDSQCAHLLQKHVFFGIVDLGRAGETLAFLAGDLGHGALGGEIAAQNLDVPGLLDRVFQRLHHFLAGFQRRADAARFSASVLPVTVRQSPSSKPFSSRYFITAGVPPTLCKSSCTYWPLGFKIGQVRHAVADLLEIVDRQRHVHRAGHRDQMQHGIGRAAQGHHHDHRVFESARGS